MTDKLTPNTMKNQYDHQWNVFVRKNHDYGNSFEKSLDTFGLVAGIVRMNDKFERLLSLTRGDKDAQIASESLVDTLEDLSNYAAMTACWLKGKKENDRVMLDMMLSRIDKIVDKEDESIFHEREGWEEEVKLEGQNGSSVTFTEDDGIFSFGDGVIARSLGDITLTAGPGKPKEKKKTLNEIRKEHGFDPVNGEDNEGQA